MWLVIQYGNTFITTKNLLCYCWPSCRNLKRNNIFTWLFSSIDHVHDRHGLVSSYFLFVSLYFTLIRSCRFSYCHAHIRLALVMCMSSVCVCITTQNIDDQMKLWKRKQMKMANLYEISHYFLDRILHRKWLAQYITIGEKFLANKVGKNATQWGYIWIPLKRNACNTNAFEKRFFTNKRTIEKKTIIRINDLIHLIHLEI